MKVWVYREISGEITRVLEEHGALESGQICVRIPTFNTSQILYVLRDMVKQGVILKEKAGTKPFLESVMLRNVYKYKVRSEEC